MEIRIYLIITAFFIIGGGGIWKINRQKSNVDGRRNWVKYATFLIIINLLFLSIVILPVLFHYITLIILTAGLVEIINLFKGSGWQKKPVFILSLVIYSLFSIGFYIFGWMEKELLLFTFLITAAFDSFSQISGQLFGRHKLIPGISPSKTREGLLGGTLISFFAAFILSDLITYSWPITILVTSGIILFAFAGDIFFSWYKRQYRVKDFSNVLPGHGGFLDRFDSLIAAGTFITLFYFMAT